MKLTVSFFERIKKTKNPDEFKEYRDDACPGLVLRRRKTSWRWEVRWAPGRAFPHERIDLGNDASLEEARDLASKFRAIARANVDYPPDYVTREFTEHLRRWRLRKSGVMPTIRSREPRPAPPPSIPYKTAVALYSAELKRTRRERTAEDYTSILRRRDFAKLSERPVREIRRMEIASIIAAIHAKGHERQAETAAVALKGLWKFLGRDDMRTKTGVAVEEMKGLSAPERSLVEDEDVDQSLHVPKRDEIGKIIRWLRRSIAPLPESAGKRERAAAAVVERDRLAAMLLVYTVQRRRAVARAVRSDFENIGNGTGLWRIRPAHRKSASLAARRGHDVGVHVVPLPPSAWAIVERAMKLAGDSRYLFPGVRSRRHGAAVTSMSEYTISHLFEEIEGCEASPHDMRRALGTTYRIAAGYTVGDVGLILDHGKREDMDGEDVTADHYAFSVVGKKAWAIMTGWCDFVDAAGDPDARSDPDGFPIGPHLTIRRSTKIDLRSSRNNSAPPCRAQPSEAPGHSLDGPLNKTRRSASALFDRQPSDRDLDAEPTE